jgi:hypothetical protein
MRENAAKACVFRDLLRKLDVLRFIMVMILLRFASREYLRLSGPRAIKAVVSRISQLLCYTGLDLILRFVRLAYLRWLLGPWRFLGAYLSQNLPKTSK